MTQRLLNSITAARNLIILVLFIAATVNKTVHASYFKPSPDLVTSFQFKLLSGGVIIVEARVEDYPDTLNFILDTGSGGISLDSTTVKFLRLPVTPSDRTLRGIGSIRKISYVRNKTLHLPKLDIEHLDFHINDYELLTSVYGVKIDGIIGFSFLSRYVVKIDYDKSIIEVWKRGSVKYPKNGVLIHPVITGIPIFNATIADGNVSNNRFYFDTGAGLCLLMSEDFERDSSIFKKGKKIIATQAEGIGGKNQMRLSTVKQIQIGKYKFKKVPAHVFRDDYNVTSYPQLGGLIGNDLLRRFNIILNYDEREIHIKPNSHFREPFDYSYTGLGVYFVDGQVVIEDVLEDSPGETAGLKPGDVIIGIDNTINGNIQAYKNMLQTVGARLKLLIRRNDQLVVLRLKVGTIL